MGLLSRFGLIRQVQPNRVFASADDLKVPPPAAPFVDWEAKYKRAVTDLAAQAVEIAALLDAGKDVIGSASDHYTARNNRRMTIQGDDGEKCWIVPFDQFEHLRHTLNRINDQRDRDMKAAKRGAL